MIETIDTALLEQTDAIVDSYDASKQFSLAMLQDVQRAYNYLPRAALERIAQRLDMSLGEVQRLATFFTAFSLQPRGEYVCRVCLGTACHVRGSPRILEALVRELDINPGETTPDGKFSLEAVRCLGACALAPVLMINEEPYGSMTPDKATRLIAELAAKEAEPAAAAPEPQQQAKAELAQVAQALRLDGFEDLHKLRGQLQKDLQASVETSTTFTVGMGTCGISAGAQAVMDAVVDELERRDIQARVTATGCVGMCSQEPLLDVQQANEPRITYGHVTPDKVARIVEEHLKQGRVVEEWVVGRVPTGGER